MESPTDTSSEVDSPKKTTFNLTVQVEAASVFDLQACLRSLVDLLEVDFRSGTLSSPTSSMDFTLRGSPAGQREEAADLFDN